MENEKTIDVSNSLININNDRIEGYDTATKESDEQDLKTLFARFISTSHKCKRELVSVVTGLGDEEAEGTKVSGKFLRIWMDFKAALPGKDRKAILNSCGDGEEEALDTYNKALENDLEYLSADHREMINAQKALLKADHEHVKALRDKLQIHA